MWNKYFTSYGEFEYENKNFQVTVENKWQMLQRSGE